MLSLGCAARRCRAPDDPATRQGGSATAASAQERREVGHNHHAPPPPAPTGSSACEAALSPLQVALAAAARCRPFFWNSLFQEQRQRGALPDTTPATSAPVSARQTGLLGGKELAGGGGAPSALKRRLPRRVATPRRRSARLHLELQLPTRTPLLSILAQRASRGRSGHDVEL